MSKQFFWGASTASHQVEGGTHNQWSEWEKANANRLADSAQQRLGWLPNYNDIKAQAKNPNNYISGNAVEHYLRYKEDFALAKQLNLNALRFGIEWSRIEPKQGKWDQDAIDHYKNYITEMHRVGLEPFITLWHWTMPVWFANMGGFTKKSNIKFFERYVKKISDELLGDVNYVITINEPNVYATFSYILGNWPPQQKSLITGLRVYNNLATAHKRAYKIIKSSYPDINISAAQQIVNSKPFRKNNIIDKTMARMANYTWHWWWLNKTQKYHDFIGINFYFTDYYKGFKRHNPKTPLNDLGWYMEPSGIVEILAQVAKRYKKKPIIITENGCPDAKDDFRQWWLEQTMQALEQAKQQNIPVKGYLHWSLVDNFEWADGWWPKFGLIEVDRKTLKRTIRPSAETWAKHLSKVNY